MRCPRCGRRADEASWYCAHCGASLAGVNVADSVGGRRLPPLVRFALLASVTLLVAIAVVTVGAIVARRGSTPEAAPPGSGTDVAALPGGGQDQPTATPTEVRPPRIVTAVPQGTPMAPPPERPDAPTWRVARIAPPPTIDGRLDEWSTEPLAVDAVVFGQNFWRGPEDLSARAYAGWDDQALYLAVQVTDDVFSQPARGEELYLGDSIEVQIDADLAGDWSSQGYNDDDWQIGLSPGDFGDAPPEAFVWRPDLRPAESVRLAAMPLESGYALEAAIPWALLGVDPARTPGIGIALNASDNDDPRPAQLTMVSSAPRRSWSDPGSFATLWLVR